MTCHRIGRPPMGIIGLGTSSATSRMRVPLPPHRITTCILAPPLARTGRRSPHGECRFVGEVSACGGCLCSVRRQSGGRYSNPPAESISTEHPGDDLGDGLLVHDGLGPGQALVPGAEEGLLALLELV